MRAKDVIEASANLRQAAAELAELSERLGSPSSSGQVIGALLDAQGSIEETLRELAQWHKGTIPGVHFAEHHPESAEGVSAVIKQLDRAAQQAGGLRETLSQAYEGSGVVCWFDDVQELPAHPFLPVPVPENVRGSN
ncbi:hypothetical protein ACIPY3_14760 [Paenarthrobacter sp. NPDC089714]|uniref:hypothetical protein n=1 Tax=Paenarthrobacter sp. NPDC089714 TaxID=3364377 RepID=UPI0037F4CA90